MSEPEEQSVFERVMEQERRNVDGIFREIGRRRSELLEQQRRRENAERLLRTLDIRSWT